MVSSINLGQASLQETALPSAATTDLGSISTWKVSVTGTTPITSFGTRAHCFKALEFAAALTLTHNATSLILPGAADIATAAGDTCLATSDGSGNWRVRAYQRADGKPIVALSMSDISGTLQAAQEPAHTGDMTNAAGSLATTVGSIGGKSVSLGGNFSTSGAFAVAFTVNAATALTLPASGTVATVGIMTLHGDSNYTILSTDRTVATSAALTAPRAWTLPASNSLLAGSEIVVADFARGVTSTNTLAIQRTGSDTIDGVATPHVLAAAGGYVRLRTDGSANWKTLGRSTNIVSFSASGTYTPTPGMTVCDVYALGAGGAGGGGCLQAASTACSGGSGGGGGSAVSGRFTAAQVGASQAVTVGTSVTGGLAASVNSAAGGNGGSGANTTFGALLRAGGGGGGAGGQLGAVTSGGGGGGSAGGAGVAATGAAGGAGNFPAGSGGTGINATNVSVPSGGGGGGGSSAIGAPGAGASTVQSGAGGGGGGGITSSNGLNNGLAGGAVIFGLASSSGLGGTTGGTVAGGNGGAPPAGQPLIGAGGGGGGGASSLTAAGPGGAGALGAGGGGGGSAQNGGAAGPGGAGGAGICYIIEFFS